MKRKMLVVTMVISMMMAGLMAACGNNDVPANAIIDTPTPTSEPTQTPAPTIAPDDEGVVDSGVLDDVPDEGEDGNGEFSLGDYEREGVRTVFTSLFPSGSTAEAWNEEHRFTNSQDYSYYITYFKNGNGDEMSFTWVAKTGIGELWGLSTNERTFDVANDNSRLYMWHGGKLASESEYMRNFSKEEIMSASNLSYVAETFQTIEMDNTYKVIFQVSTQLDGRDYIGYECWVERYDEMTTYMFEYFVEASLFNETEALSVVSSIVPINLDDLGIIITE